MEEHVLIKAGLTANESRIYLLLLKSQEAIASDIAKQTEISRPHVYDSINKLIEKGLVSYVIKDHKRYFKAANPNELINYLEEEKSRIDDKKKEITGFMPKLLKMHKEMKAKSSVEVYEGKEGLKTVLMDIINNCKSFTAFGATHKFEGVLPVFSKLFVKIREEKKIKADILAVEGENPIKTKMNNYRWIPKEYSLPSSTIMYGDKTAILLWSGEPFGIIIKSKEITNSYNSYFKLLWKIGKKK
ncbi:MAG: ArsR family transcriptional regulator [Nanoarchaeota archaeon]|nr:ArsR family transcriptional regulator [Nanoarchaeota archaeon]MBU1004424.1 ArsR family transcriptional regulator [Nanoarchaeota archaeon]MBU1946689.1 ArsR family transcriptional regulator [Nanoarchaeota archaeon]